MAGAGITRDTIRRHIGGSKMSKTTFYKALREELKTGDAHLYAEVVAQIAKAVRSGAAWAIQLCARNMPELAWDRYDKNGTPYIAKDGEGIKVQVNFKLPSREEPPVDVTPPNPYLGQSADYNKPAIEPPRQRQTTDSGAVYEEPRKPHPFDVDVPPRREPASPGPYDHLPKMYPPDHVDNTKPLGGGVWTGPPDPKGWMK
jgi:hypothetical protein